MLLLRKTQIATKARGATAVPCKEPWRAVRIVAGAAASIPAHPLEWRNVPMMTSIEFKKISIADARREIEDEPKQSDERLRKYPRAAQENDVLLNTTLTWMAGLPKDAPPI